MFRYTIFGWIVLICAIVWVIRMWRKRWLRPLCPDCRRWHENTCSVFDRPNVTRCRLFEPEEDFSEITREAIEEEEEASVIEWDQIRRRE